MRPPRGPLPKTVAVAVAALALLAAAPARRASAAPLELQPYLGARAASEAFRFDGDDGTSLSGAGVAIDVGARLSAPFRAYATWDHGVFDTRSDRLAPGPLAKSDGLGLALRIDAAPDAELGVAIDVGAGVRRLEVPYRRADGSCGEDRFRGIEPVRAHVGPSLRLEGGLRIDLLFGGALGAFRGPRGHGETCTIVASCQDSLLDSAGDGQTNAYFLLDVSLALHFGY